MVVPRRSFFGVKKCPFSEDSPAFSVLTLTPEDPALFRGRVGEWWVLLSTRTMHGIGHGHIQCLRIILYFLRQSRYRCSGSGERTLTPEAHVSP